MGDSPCLNHSFLHPLLNRADKSCAGSVEHWLGHTLLFLEPNMQTAITDWGSAMMTSLAAAMALFLSAIPKIIGFVVILVVGWFLSSLIDKGLSALLRRVRFNDFASRSGFADFVAKMNVGVDS